jgi:hypothetical protein
VTLSGINIDKTAPTVSGSRAPAPNAAGWNNSPVVVSFSAVDPLSGVNPSDCSTPVTLATDGSGQAATGNCLDKAGNSGSATVSGISIDRTPPVATALATPAPNGAGWNNSNVTVSFTGTDSLSGSGVAGCSTATVISVEAAGQAVSGNCTDVAGNVSAAASRTVRIDKTGPTASITTPANGASFVQGTQVLASYQCTDALSGIAQCSGNVPTGLPIDTASAGSKTFTVSATDAAGNVSLPATVSYTVISTNTTDTTPPVIVPTVAGTVGANGWYRSNVSLTWSVTDPESQIRSTVGCGPATLASDTTGKTYACKATSTGGTAAVSITLKRDTSSPLVTIRVPTSESHDATYRLGQAVRASYSCADSPSGVASCAGSVPSGALLDTSSRGTKTLSVTATDNAGNIRTVNQSYRVN